MLKHQVKHCLILLLHVLTLSAARGTEGGAVNQWNPNPGPQQFPQTKGAPLGGWDDDVSNPQGGVVPQDSPMWKIEDAIPGVPGQSYPNHDKVPQTSFDCRRQMSPGYYADMETQCQVFHICQADGRQNSFLCPLGTIFNQETFVCDWWFNVICADAPQFTSRNDNLYKSPHLGIDGQKVPSYGQRSSGQNPEEQGQRSGGPAGNIQPQAVGLPHINSQGTGGSWPPQGDSRRNDNMKGDGRNMNQPAARGQGTMGNRPNRMNQKGVAGRKMSRRNPSNMAGGPSNPGADQKGPRGRNGWNNQQQGMRPRGNGKGGNNQQGPRSNAWSQMGGGNNPQGPPSNAWSQMGGGNNPQGPPSNAWSQMGGGNNQGGTKGDAWNPRRTVMQGNNQGGRNQVGQNQMGPNGKGSNQNGLNQMGPNQNGLNQMGPNQNGLNQMGPNQNGLNQMGPDQKGLNQMGPNRMRPRQNGANQMGQNRMGQNQNKGFNANSWSMRPQSIRGPAQGTGDAWTNRDSAGPEDGNLSAFPKGQQDSHKDFGDSRGAVHPDGSWRNGDRNGQQWDRNMADGQDQQGFSQNYAWNSENGFKKESSWQSSDQFESNHAVDYDYE